MTALASRGSGLRCSISLGRRGPSITTGPVRPAPCAARPVCRPVLLAPRPQTPRRPRRARLVTTNFKNSDEEAPVIKPAQVRHPLTEDTFASPSPAETATQEVLFSSPAGGAASAAAAPPQQPQGLGAVDTVSRVVRQMAGMLTRPRALLRSLARNSAAYGLPLLVAYLARQPLAAFWVFYNTSLDAHPVLTKIATGVVGTILGDYLAQRLSHHHEEQAARSRGEPVEAFVYDLGRTARLVVYGVVVSTPVGHLWFKFLDTSVMPDAMTSMPAVLTKMALDQLIMSPLSTALFFMVMRAWEGHPQDAFHYMRGKMMPTLKANYLLWPLAHIINFALVPPSQRILYCNAVGLIWTVILSTILNSRAVPAAAPPTAAGSSGPVKDAPMGGSPDSLGGGQPMGPEDLSTAAPAGFGGMPASSGRPPAYARYTKPRDADSRRDA
ncbi:hypothetical protein HXX76_011308 [Chlamydomonas incerta]|uniref:Uncharacterized protein n=1 Tax=Chlamydomonas incerta TaxID=51695 RepID=A0A835SL41_CHLIN|nr:hypothetical protein HXX76_011308 [Chlamydomonas incerta]|eukprot:KAG2429068.1 hypothetical protein HXX76_011308 [Chlamydomonas incerta]